MTLKTTGKGVGPGSQTSLAKEYDHFINSYSSRMEYVNDVTLHKELFMAGAMTVMMHLRHLPLLTDSEASAINEELEQFRNDMIRSIEND